MRCKWFFLSFSIVNSSSRAHWIKLEKLQWCDENRKILNFQSQKNEWRPFDYFRHPWMFRDEIFCCCMMQFRPAFNKNQSKLFNDLFFSCLIINFDRKRNNLSTFQWCATISISPELSNKKYNLTICQIILQATTTKIPEEFVQLNPKISNSNSEQLYWTETKDLLKLNENGLSSLQNLYDLELNRSPSRIRKEKSFVNEEKLHERNSNWFLPFQLHFQHHNLTFLLLRVQNIKQDM